MTTYEQQLTDAFIAGFRAEQGARDQAGTKAEGAEQIANSERGIEEALRNFAGNGANGGGEAPEMTAAERIEKIGNVSALAIIEANETTAKDIEAAAQAAVDIAADIMAEATQLATGRRANGKKIGDHLKESAPTLSWRLCRLRQVAPQNSAVIGAGLRRV